MLLLILTPARKFEGKTGAGLRGLCSGLDLVRSREARWLCEEEGQIQPPNDLRRENSLPSPRASFSKLKCLPVFNR